MSQRIAKFMNLVASTPAAIYGSLSSSGILLNDSVSTILGKIQGLLSQRSVRSVILSPVTGGASSTALVQIVTLTVPANVLQVGDIIRMRFMGYMNKPLSSSTTVTITIAVTGLTAFTAVITPTAAISGNELWEFNGDLVFVSSTSCFASGRFTIYPTTTTTLLGNFISALTSGINTASPLTVTASFNFSNSNASNTMTAQVASLILT